MKQRLLGLLLMVDMGCRGHNRAMEAGLTPRDESPSDSLASVQPEEVEPFTPLELQLYERGRRAEIAALHGFLAEPVHHGALALDSIGAAAAGLRVEWYRIVTARMDSTLMRNGEAGNATGSGTGGPPRARWASGLDSLRLERLVLLIRTKDPR
jgi:hypothetical protein